MTIQTPERKSDILGFTRQVLWSNSLNGILGRLLGALSFLALARYALDFGLSAAATKVYEYYDHLLRMLFGWLDPYFESWVVGMLSSLNLHIEFNEYWRHIFVVLQLLFARDAGVAFSKGRRVVGSVRLAVGFVIAVVVSVLAAISVTEMSTVLSNVFFATLPTLGIYLYDVAMYCHSALFQMDYLNGVDETPGRSRGEFFTSAMLRATLRLALGLLVSYATFLLPAVRHASAPAGGLVAIGLATVANASYWLWRGGRYAAKNGGIGRRWIEAFNESEAGRFGVAVTGVIVWAIIFATLNAGMQQVGL